MTDADRTRAIKAVLHRKFPDSEFSVTRGGERVAWTDDGPAVGEVQDVLLKAGCAQERVAWNGERCLEVGRYDIWFDRYNAAERAADQQDLERRRQEEADLCQHISNVVRQADKAKREAAGVLRGARSQPPPITDSTIFMDFERLRQRAEKEAAFEEGAERPNFHPHRPSGICRVVSSGT